MATDKPRVLSFHMPTSFLRLLSRFHLYYYRAICLRCTNVFRKQPFMAHFFHLLGSLLSLHDLLDQLLLE